MNQDLAVSHAIHRHPRTPSYRLYLAMTVVFMTSACASATPTPAATPPETATESLVPAETSVEPRPAATEPYEPVVRSDNHRPVEAAAVPFAHYIVSMHSRIHPIFAEELKALDGPPDTQTRHDESATNVEIVIDKDTGKVVRVGVLKAGPRTGLDSAVLSAIERAAPFDKAPDIIASPDGKVYVHWTFRRDPVEACSPRNARPYLLTTTP